MIASKLVADFSQFLEATKEATEGLAGMESQSKSTEAAIATATKIDPANVKTFTEETKRMGTEVRGTDTLLAGLSSRVAQAFTVTAIVGFAKWVIDTQSEITKLSAALGMTGEEVQSLQYIAAQTSVPMSAFESAVNHVTKSLGTNDTGFIGALSRLGISLTEFRAMNSYEQFLTLGDALGKIEDPAKRAAESSLTLGRAWKEITPAMLKDMRELADQAPKTSDANREAINRWEDSLRGLWATFKATVGNMTGEFARGLESGANASMRDIPVPNIMENPRLGVLPDMATSTLVEYRNALLAVPPALKEITLSAEDAKKIGDELDASYKKQAETAKRTADETDRFNAAMIEVNGAGRSWAETLDGINGDAVEAIKYYLQMGVSQSDLAAAYGLTGREIKAVNVAMTEEAAFMKAIEQSIEDTAAVRKKDAEASKEQAKAQAAHAQSIMETDTTTREYYRAIAEKAAEAYAIATKHADSYTIERLEQLRTESEAADRALADWSQTATTVMADVDNAAGQAAAAIRTVNEEIKRMERPNTGGNPGLIQAGGATFPSSDSLWAASMNPGSMLAGPTRSAAQLANEFDQRFRAAMSTDPNRESDFWLRQIGAPTSGQNVTVQSGAVSVNYPIMNDPSAMDQLARVVGDAIMSRITRTGAVV